MRLMLFTVGAKLFQLKLSFNRFDVFPRPIVYFLALFALKFYEIILGHKFLL